MGHSAIVRLWTGCGLVLGGRLAAGDEVVEAEEAGISDEEAAVEEVDPDEAGEQPSEDAGSVEGQEAPEEPSEPSGDSA